MRDTSPTAEPQSTVAEFELPQSEPQSAEPVPEPVETEAPQSSVNVVQPPGQDDSADGGIDYSAEIAVLNNSGVAGLAGTAAGSLEGHGFTNVIAENAEQWTTEVNTVYYADPAMESTAMRVAELLGIDSVQHYEPAAADGAVVVLIVQ